MDQGSNKNHSPAYNFTPTVTKFCVMWEGLSLPHDTKFGNCRCKIVDSRAFPSWSLIHGLRWSGLIKAEPGQCSSTSRVEGILISFEIQIQDSKAIIRQCTDINHINQRNNVKKRIKYFLMNTRLETLVKAVWPLSQRPPENVWKYWAH